MRSHTNRIYETGTRRSEEHTSELQSRQYLVCRLLLEKKKTGLVTQATRSGHSPLLDHMVPPSACSDSYGTVPRLIQRLYEHSLLTQINPSPLPAILTT